MTQPGESPGIVPCSKEKNMANPNRAPKSEVRRQLKAAKRWASKQKNKSVNAEVWRDVCPKAAR